MAGDMLPFLIMVIVQFGYGGMNIVSTLAMDSGMNPFIHVAYRQVFASVAIAPFAYFLERKTRPKLTLPIFFQIFLCSIFGVTLNQITYFVGMKNSNPTIACALSNLLPALTFLLAVPFRLESVGIKRKAGQAKALGTLVCVGGAMLLSFYNGPVIGIGESNIHLKYATSNDDPNHKKHVNFILGPFLLIVSSFSWAIWLIIQAKVSAKYTVPYSSSALMCFMASVECVAAALFVESKPSAWALSPTIRAVSCVYAGIVCSALAFCLMTWCIERKGPLYVSVFGPLLMIIVAILSWVFLRQKLYLGTVVGSVLIVLGLYGVLWGKNKEVKQMGTGTNAIIDAAALPDKLNQEMKQDLELQFKATT